MSEKSVAWKEVAKKVGYEGAAAYIVNSKKEILWNLSMKDDETLQAEIMGGKPEIEDGGDPRQTLIREVKEEADIDLDINDLLIRLETTGGTTGFPSFQFITKPLDHVVPKKLEKFIGHVWSKAYLSKENGWYIQREEEKKSVIIKIRKFNTFALDQNRDSLMEYIVIAE